jgi:hypothetical protein
LFGELLASPASEQAELAQFPLSTPSPPFAKRSTREEDVFFVNGIHDDILRT